MLINIVLNIINFYKIIIEYYNYNWFNNSELIFKINNKNYSKFKDILVKFCNTINDSDNDSIALSVN